MARGLEAAELRRVMIDTPVLVYVQAKEGFVQRQTMAHKGELLGIHFSAPERGLRAFIVGAAEQGDSRLKIKRRWGVAIHAAPIAPGHSFRMLPEGLALPSRSASIHRPKSMPRSWTYWRMAEKVTAVFFGLGQPVAAAATPSVHLRACGAAPARVDNQRLRVHCDDCAGCQRIPLLLRRKINSSPVAGQSLQR